MGGFGSGRWGWHTAKQTVEDGLSLPTTYLRATLGKVADGVEKLSVGTLQWSRRSEVMSRIGFMVRSGSRGPLVNLIYTTTHRDGTKTDSDYPIEVVATEPTFGGRRWWWICPLVKSGVPCQRRVGKLYCPPGYIYFGCRHCYELTYRSCQESHKYDGVFAGIAKDTGYSIDTVKRALNHISNGPR